MGSAASSKTSYEDLKAKLVSLYTLLRWQKVSKLIHHTGLGDRHPTALMDAMLALLPEDKKPGCLFQDLFLERLTIEMRDHLVFREFKNPSEMALYADSLWDARKAIPTDHLLAAASTSSSSPLRGRAQDRRSPSPNRRSQTPGPSNVLVLQPTIVALLAISREMPEPTGGGKIKQPSRLQLSLVPSRCPVNW